MDRIIYWIICVFLWEASFAQNVLQETQQRRGVSADSLAQGVGRPSCSLTKPTNDVAAVFQASSAELDKIDELDEVSRVRSMPMIINDELLSNAKKTELVFRMLQKSEFRMLEDTFSSLIFNGTYSRLNHAAYEFLHSSEFLIELFRWVRRNDFRSVIYWDYLSQQAEHLHLNDAEMKNLASEISQVDSQLSRQFWVEPKIKILSVKKSTELREVLPKLIGTPLWLSSPTIFLTTLQEGFLSPDQIQLGLSRHVIEPQDVLVELKRTTKSIDSGMPDWFIDEVLRRYESVGTLDLEKTREFFPRADMDGKFRLMLVGVALFRKMNREKSSESYKHAGEGLARLYGSFIQEDWTTDAEYSEKLKSLRLTAEEREKLRTQISKTFLDRYGSAISEDSLHGDLILMRATLQTKLLQQMTAAH
jgi:hypothetical protein